MKKILFGIIGGLWLLNACDQNHVDVWEDDGKLALHFVIEDTLNDEIQAAFGATVYNTNQTEHANFIYEYWNDKAYGPNAGVEDWRWGLFNQGSNWEQLYALGDSSAMVYKDSLEVTYSGNLRTEDFTYRLVQRRVGEAEMSEIDFVKDTLAPEEAANVFVFRGGETRNKVRFFLKRPAEYGEFKFDLVADTTAADYGPGITEYNSRRFIITNKVELPEGVTWNEKWLGEYSPEKYMFFMTILHIPFYKTQEDAFNNANNNQFIKECIWQVLVDALEEYNNTHPDNKKTFVFPDESELPV